MLLSTPYTFESTSTFTNLLFHSSHHGAYNGGCCGGSDGGHGSSPCYYYNFLGHVEEECPTKALQQPQPANVAQATAPTLDIIIFARVS